MANAMKKFLRETGIFTTALTLAFIIFLGVTVAQGEWTEPSASPPQGNLPPPVNVGEEAQTKSGVLGAWDFWISSWYRDDPGSPTGAYAGLLIQNERRDWKLLARGNDYTEEAQINISSSGISAVTDYSYANQKVNIGAFSWPPDPKAVTEIMLVARSRSDDFCAGGRGVQNLTGPPGWSSIGTFASCVDYRCQGERCTPVTISNQNDWIRLVINNNIISGVPCRSPFKVGGQDMLNTTEGRYGSTNVGVQCHYIKGPDWQGDLTSLQLQEVDWSPYYGVWEWEIWYRNFEKSGQPSSPRPSPPPSGGGSFAAGTKVLTPAGAKNIEELKAGDRVLSFDIEQKKIVEGRVEIERSRDSSDYYLVNNSLKVTAEHPIAVLEAQTSRILWKKVKDLQVGDIMMDIRGGPVMVNAVSLVRLEAPIRVYNPSISYPRNYFVLLGNSAVLVHNKANQLPDCSMDLGCPLRF